VSRGGAATRRGLAVRRSRTSDTSSPEVSPPEASSPETGGPETGGASRGSVGALATQWAATGPGGAAELPEGTAAVLHALPGAAMVVVPDGQVVLATTAAVAMRLVRYGRLQVDELLDLVRSVAGDGVARDVTVEAGWRGRIRPDGAGRSLAAWARVLPTAERPTVLLLIEDRTESLRVDAARQDFVVNVSHELKTPVGAISLLAEAMQAAADDPTAVIRFARRMQSESERLARLVGEIVELSRLQLHDPVEDSAPLQVAGLVAAAVDRSRVDADAKDIEMVAAVPPELTVTGSVADLTSALGNLVENALAYSPSRTRVTITAASVPATSPDAPAMVDVAVADQGIGIPADKLDRIFERFFRLDEARSRVTGGTGLGLAIVKHIASGHGGSVRVWSVRGAGSTFTLQLPVEPPGRIRDHTAGGDW